MICLTEQPPCGALPGLGFCPCRIARPNVTMLRTYHPSLRQTGAPELLLQSAATLADTGPLNSLRRVDQLMAN